MVVDKGTAPESQGARKVTEWHIIFKPHGNGVDIPERNRLAGGR